MHSPTVVAAVTTGAAAWPAAATARTVVAAAATARLLVPGRRPQTVGYLDDEGQPVLIVAVGPTAARLEGPGVLLIRAGAGLVRLGGRLRLPAAKTPTGRAVADGGPVAGPLRAVRFEVDRVLLGRPGTEQLVVPVDGYVEAVPDLFAAHGHHVADHLQDEHDDLLRAVVRGRVDRADASEVIAVGVHSLEATGVQLDAITCHGAVRLRVGLRLTDPWEACEQLPDLAPDVPGTC